MHAFLYISLIYLLLQVSWAQNVSREVVWGSVAFTRYGESVPYGLPRASTLTPLGAQQLAGAGYAFRKRYLKSSSNPSLSFSRIRGLSRTLNNDEIEVSTIPDESIVASAQAFMQGLYPPSIASAVSGGLPSNMAEVNGTLIDYPLNGYQYPLISTYNYKDRMSAHISGHTNCPQHTDAVWAFSTTKEYQEIFEKANDFYADLYSRLLFDVYERDKVGVFYAPMIYEYLSYQYLHNPTAKGTISRSDIDQARYFADQWAHATSRNTDASWSKDGILAIGGRSLAYFIVRALQDNEDTKGSSNKLSLVFGGYEPMMAFIQIAISAQHREGLGGIPNHGASMIIDLFSVEEDGPIEYPRSDTKLMVRFLLRNGTDAFDPETPFIAYPMFGNSLHRTAMPYKEFISRMVDNMMSTSEWCLGCGSKSGFCSPSPSCPSSKKHCTSSDLNGGEIYFLLFSGACILILLFFLGGLGRCLWGRFKMRKRASDTTYHSNSNRMISAGGTSSVAGGWELVERRPFRSRAGSAGSTFTNTSDDSDTEQLLSPAANPVKIRESV
ncbi:hypothetical protein FQN49_000136 [Arthroderma sp. PD_2]|nr:hypothetical protein FQN49_000136 [Arthroderma sp. PD_2]